MPDIETPRFSIKIDMDNAAFQDGNQTNEIKRILNRIMVQIENGVEGGSVKDVNGNKCGSWEVEYIPVEEEKKEFSVTFSLEHFQSIAVLAKDEDEARELAEEELSNLNNWEPAQTSGPELVQIDEA